MKGLFAFAALLAVAAAAHYGGNRGDQEIVPDLFEGQREYVYNYRSLVATGLPRQSQRFAGLEKYGVLTVQVNEQQANTKILGLRLRDVRSGSFDKDVEDIENRRIEGVSHSVEETIEKYGPVFVKIQDNEVQKLKAPENMPEEIINIYRGIAAIFTVGKPETLEGDNHPFMPQEKRQDGEQQPIVYRRQEQGIAGNFETIYEILSNTENQYNQQLNLTKTRNYMKQIGPDGRFLQNGHDGRGCQNVCRTHKPEQVDNNMQPELSDWMKPSAEGCPVNFHPKTDLVEAFTTYNYNMTVERNGKFALIQEAQAIDKKVLPLRKQQIKTVSLIKLLLVEERPQTQTWSQQEATKSYDEITYRFPEGHQWDLQYLSLYNKAQTGEMVMDQIIPMIKALSKVIVSDNIELKGQTGDKIVQLTMALGTLNKHELQSLWSVLGETASTKSASELDMVERKVLIDTIGLSGSNNATELLLELMQQQKLSTLETVETLQTFQQNLVRPTTKIMHQLKNMLTDAKVQEKRTVFGAAAIAFAEIVRANCAVHARKTNIHQHQQWSAEQGHLCGEQEYKQFVETIRGQLHSAKDFTQQTIFMQTLGRLAHPDAIKALIPYVHGEQEVIAQLTQTNGNDKNEDDSEYVQFIRQVAIYALHHAAKEHGNAVQPIVQGIYFDKQEDYELRIAALSVLLSTQPTEATFGRIVLELGQEEDLEVASYAFSALQHLANSTLPCMQQTARRVQNVLGALPEQTFGVHHSKFVAHTRYNQFTNLGLKGQWEYTQSNVSAIPRAIYASLTGNKGPFVSTGADFGMISKGLENLYQYINEKGGMTKIVENVMNRIRRDTRHVAGDQSVEQLLQQIEQAMQFNTEENNEQPRAVVFGSILGNEAFLPIDKEYITKVGQKFAQGIVELLREEGSGKTHRFVRILMPRTYVHVAPGVNGLPVVLSNRHPIVATVSLKNIQTRLGADKKQMKLNPMTFAVSGLIQPTVYHTSVHTALVINPVEKTRYAYGVRATEQTYVTLPIDASLQYTHQTNTLAFTLRPRFEKVFFHKTRAMTFKTEALLIRGVDKPLLERFTVIKTQQKPFTFDGTLGEKLGMAVRVQGISENEDFAVNFMSHKLAFEQDPITSLIKQLSNDWFTSRTWAVRVEKNQEWNTQELKMVLRLGGNLFQQRMDEKNGQQQQHQQQQRLSQDQLVKEQVYLEHMRMIAYEQEFEKITGRKPQTEQLEQSLKRIVDKTQKYWSQVDRELGQQLQKENTQVRSVEYIITAKGEKEPVAIHGHVILAASPSKQVKLAELKMDVEKMPYSLQVQGIAAFTKIPQPFETEIREQEQRGIVGVVAELETRQTGKQVFSGKIEMSKSEEQQRFMKQVGEAKPWFYKQCEEDKKEHQSEMSSACEKVRYHKSALNQLRFEIELPQDIHQGLVNASHQIRETLKLRLYRNLRADYVAEKKTQENKIQGEIIFSEQYPEMRMANLTIRTPDHEELHFERLAFPKALRPNTMWTLKQQIKAFLKLDRPEPVCVYNGQNLRTFDNVTVSLQAMKEGDKYVIARDNNEQSRFTILGEKKQGGQKSEIEVLLRDATLLKLTPAAEQKSATYKVRVNSTSVEVTSKKTEVYQYGPENKNMITLHVEEHKEGQDTLVIKVRDQRMRIVYDGKNLKVEIAKQQLKGQLTGLCGDMNNQHIDELTDSQGCNFELEEDFVRSFGLSKEANHGLKGNWMCPEGVHPRAASSQNIQMQKEHQQNFQKKMQSKFQQRQTIRDEQGQLSEETMMIPLNGKLCFSAEPVNTCQEGLRQLDSEMQNVQFLCFNQNHGRTRMLQREVQAQKVASSLPSADQSARVHHQVEVATRCGQ